MLLRHLHSEETPHFDVFDDPAGQVVLILRQLLYELLQQALVIFTYVLAQMAFNVSASSIADLKGLNAHLRHRKWKDLDVLEATVDSDAGLDSCRV